MVYQVPQALYKRPFVFQAYRNETLFQAPIWLNMPQIGPICRESKMRRYRALLLGPYIQVPNRTAYSCMRSYSIGAVGYRFRAGIQKAE